MSGYVVLTMLAGAVMTKQLWCHCQTMWTVLLWGGHIQISEFLGAALSGHLLVILLQSRGGEIWGDMDFLVVH
eukprot:scaffold74156_cov74-Attheya_sp.AAC.1